MRFIVVALLATLASSVKVEQSAMEATTEAVQAAEQTEAEGRPPRAVRRALRQITTR